jgi:hypothetical protein
MCGGFETKEMNFRSKHPNTQADKMARKGMEGEEDEDER